MERAGCQPMISGVALQPMIGLCHQPMIGLYRRALTVEGVPRRKVSLGTFPLPGARVVDIKQRTEYEGNEVQG